MQLEEMNNWVGSIIPIDNEKNYYMILTMELEENNFDKIITKEIIPLIQQEKEKS